MMQNAPRRDRLTGFVGTVFALLLVSPVLAQPRMASVAAKAPLPIARPASLPRATQPAGQTDEAQDPEVPEAETPEASEPPAPARQPEQRGLFQALFGSPAAAPPPPAEPPIAALPSEAVAAAPAAPLPVPRAASGAPAASSPPLTLAYAAPAGVLSNLNAPPPSLTSEEDQMDEEEQVEAMDPAPAPQGLAPPQPGGTGTMTFPVPGPGAPPPPMGRGQAYASLPPANSDWPRFVPGALPRETLSGIGGDRVVADPIAPLSCLPGVVKRALTDVALKYGPIIVRSTHRPPDMNRRMGGARASMHIACRAADFRIEHEPGPVLAYLRTKPELGGVKRYRNGIIHIDDGDRRSW